MTAPQLRRFDAFEPERLGPAARIAPQPGRGVVHIDLSSPLPERIEPGAFERSMVVYWWKDVPVGHAFLESRRCTPERIAALAESAVAGDLLAEAAQRPGGARRIAPVSVIVCTRDRPQELAGCLNSLLAQSRAPEEIVVVDDGSIGPAVRRVATERARVTYRRQQASGLGAARNIGIRAARHDILVFTDDDVRHHRLWLERLVRPFAESETVAATGLVLPFEIESEAQYICERGWSLGRGYRPRGFASEFLSDSPAQVAPVWEIGSGASMAFRRRALQEAGGFEERLDSFGAGLGNEVELWHRLIARGWSCRYEPAAVAYHRHRRDLDELAEQVCRQIEGHVGLLHLLHEGGQAGALGRIALGLPRLFLKLGWRRLVEGRRPQTAMLGAALRGYCAGVFSRPERRRA